ncbi:hypothetical protein HN51_001473 [Arachis hypogaea]|uniref:Uncharacterized protein LOC107487175 n=2 Tax=Arachis TaxID=3817 RepID=A0A6P4D6Q2_ARADU|nr:uncharacterized protein LOC107487175 [Arachis duranensis]XP_025702536.1 uncharacterized protein LOC112803240 [Arachis hypogaea]QHO49565.1 Elongation factor G-1 [Arachis hypogaea]
MAAQSVRMATSTLCNLNGSQKRQAMLSPVWYMGARPKPSNATATSSSHSHFFQSSRTNVSSSKLYHLHHKTPRNLSVFAMSADAKKTSEEGDKRSLPSMSDILEASRAQKLDLQLKTLGPFFRITATSLQTRAELGKAEGLIRISFQGTKILHLDSMKLRRETLSMEKSIFGLGLFIGAVAIRHGYDSGCTAAQLLAINDSDLYHSKLVRFYGRLGFREVCQVSGSSIGDIPHMLVWGGVGTRMDASIEELMLKWCTRFKKNQSPQS